MEKFVATAKEVLNWVPTHIEASLGIAAMVTAAGTITFLRLRDRFTRPTATGFDDPAVQAPRDRIRERFNSLGIPYSEP